MAQKVGRRFSLDSSVPLIGLGSHAMRRSSRFSNRKNGQTLEEARREIQELGHSLYSNLRDHTITEESHEPPNYLIHRHSFQKHNKSFHKLFPEIPEGENLTHTFVCALQKEVLYHGKLFVSENHVGFHSSVLLKDTKYSFASLRNREMCFRLLQSVCSHAQMSSYSSFEDSIDHDQTRENSSNHENGLPVLSSEGERQMKETDRDPLSHSSTRQNSLVGEDDRADSWIGKVMEMITPIFRGIRSFSILFYIYLMLIVLLLLVSGYICLRIIALEEQLNSLGAPAELYLNHREYQET
ncbi:hypothetical protein INR49_010528 [Caranx melampygus]|nr:hypothetical protein INR49_010528 [Caranx melampygus]